jgi:hypothetical protein
MIQTKEIIAYGNRSDKNGKVRIEIRPVLTSKEGVKYLVIDWDITSESSDPIQSKEVFYTNEMIDQLDALIEANHDFTGMTRTERETKKLQIALMMDTQNNLLLSGATIYHLTPNDWEFTPGAV